MYCERGSLLRAKNVYEQTIKTGRALRVNNAYDNINETLVLRTACTCSNVHPPARPLATHGELLACNTGIGRLPLPYREYTGRVTRIGC